MTTSIIASREAAKQSPFSIEEIAADTACPRNDCI